MKQKDIALILIIAFISAIVSFVVSNQVFVTSGNRQQSAEVVDAINPEFKLPSKTYFNSNSINPTQTVQLGTTNQNPFNGTGQ